MFHGKTGNLTISMPIFTSKMLNYQLKPLPHGGSIENGPYLSGLPQVLEIPDIVTGISFVALGAEIHSWSP